MGALAGERNRQRIADAARAAGDQRDAGGERLVMRAASPWFCGNTGAGSGKDLLLLVRESDTPA